MKLLLSFIAIASTVFFLNYKFTKAVRIIAFGEEETKSEARLLMSIMLIIIVSWTLYLSLF